MEGDQDLQLEKKCYRSSNTEFTENERFSNGPTVHARPLIGFMQFDQHCCLFYCQSIQFELQSTSPPISHEQCQGKKRFEAGRDADGVSGYCKESA